MKYDHKIVLEERITKAGLVYDVYFGNILVLKGRRDPEYSACRYLRDLGLTGRIGFFHVGVPSNSSIIKDLVRGATLSTNEGNQGLRTGKYRAFEN